jgi:TrmH family RNA methyltransferase
MEVKEITSTSNPLLRKIRELDDSGKRKKLGLFLVEGLKMIREAQEKEVELADIVASKSFFNSNIDTAALGAVDTLTVVPDRIFNSLCTTASSCGILATATMAKHSLDELLRSKSGPLVFGECIQDPGNLGTMIRTALAFEAQGLILSKGSVDYLSPKVVRASMGAVFSLPIVDEQDVEDCLGRLKATNTRVVALDAKATQTMDSENWPGRVVYIFGNEGHGLSSQVLEHADQIASIPISPKSESLNVAVAMGIVLYQARLELSSDGAGSR